MRKKEEERKKKARKMMEQGKRFSGRRWCECVVWCACSSACPLSLRFSGRRWCECVVGALALVAS